MLRGCEAGKGEQADVAYKKDRLHELVCDAKPADREALLREDR
jgi:hypothetical protein